ncbi:DUF1405 domain-containing protein [Halarchaeum acidiphilum]|uniref:DUF1405 domain-containing protein n=1 Tax=Halarchaeum acidiphilum TaxID=489138 RepID=UPI0003617440|nr:DUF1405 domain-containing protein [Halarchaeum acidiphilum]
MRSFIPERIASPYLDYEASRVILLVVNAGGILMGLNFYLPQLPSNAASFLAEALLIADSPLSMVWMVASLLTLWGVGRRYYPSSPFLDALTTVAFASMLKYGVWTVFVLNYFFALYGWQEYVGILFYHALMAVEAFLLPYYGRTSKAALGLVAVWFVANDVADYAFGLHPHLPDGAAGPGALVWVTPLLSLVSLALAWYCLDGGRDDPTTV